MTIGSLARKSGARAARTAAPERVHCFSANLLPRNSALAPDPVFMRVRSSPVEKRAVRRSPILGHRSRDVVENKEPLMKTNSLKGHGEPALKRRRSRSGDGLCHGEAVWNRNSPAALLPASP
jgi:hypothetical protein